MDLTDRFPKFSSYPPAPNWYTHNVAAVVEPNFFLYGSRNIVIVLSLKDLRYFTSFIASKDKKIIALAAHETFCYTATEDKIVRVWNLVVGSLLTSHSAHESNITALTLIRNGGTVISGDKDGKIVTMDVFAGGKVSLISKVKSEVTSIATTVVDGQEYMAVGYANGLIFIEKIHTDLSMETVFQIAEDNDPIHILDWQVLPTSAAQQPSEAPAPATTQWPLLASSTRNRKKICIWDVPANELHTVLKLPPPPGQATDTQKASLWITLSWSILQHNRIYVSSFVGTILCYELVGQKFKINNAQRLENHSRHVFSMNHFNNGRNCITTSLDKQIILWDLSSKSKHLISLRTQAAFPYSMDIPRDNPGQLAIGMGDNSIKLWDFSSNRILNAKRLYSYYNASIVWKGLQGRIEKIRWHPTRAGVLAFSNEFGHIGLYDISNSSNQRVKIGHNGKGAPHLDWGGDLSAVLDCADMQDTLLTCGPDGVIHVYDVNDPKNTPFNLNQTIGQFNAAWVTSLIAMNTIPVCIKTDPQQKFLAVGHDSGLVEIYGLDNLKIIYASNCQRQTITSLDWKYFKDKLYLASGSVDGSLAIHDIGSIDRQKLPETPVPHPEPAYRLHGHRKAITVVKWSDHNDKCLLASASEDSFAIVWNVPESKPVSLFNKHRSKVLSLNWNLEQPDQIFTGAEDRFIYQWFYTDFPCEKRIDAHLPLFDEEVEKLKTNEKKRKADAVGASSNTSKGPATTAQQAKKKQKQNGSTPITRQILDTFNKAETMTSKVRKAQYCLILANSKLDDAVYKASDSLLQTHLTEEQRNDSAIAKYGFFWSSTRVQTESQKSYERTFELFFGDKNDIKQLVNEDVQQFHQQQQVNTAPVYNIDSDFTFSTEKDLVMDVMRCQLNSFKKDSAASKSCLSDWIALALSPMIGKQKWIDLMLQQAKKLEHEQQYNLAATCYIACSHIHYAIEMYKRHQKFQEALILAKLRLPPNDPCIPALFADWAKLLQIQNQDLLAAVCYILSDIPGSIQTAINLIARNDKEAFLYYAACLSVAIDEDNKAIRIEHWKEKVTERLNKRKDVESINNFATKETAESSSLDKP